MSHTQLGSSRAPGSAHAPLGRTAFTSRLAPVGFAVLALLATLSLVAAIREALKGGIDFQWSGARLLGLHLDPWAIMIAGDPSHLILHGQTPNYLHELYVLFLPLGHLSLHHALAVWCVVNLLMLAAILWLTTRLFQLQLAHSLLLVLLTLISTPFRNTLANGQSSLFILLMLTLFFSLPATAPGAFALGLSYAKYSFSPVLVLFLLLRQRFKVLALSLIPPALGLVIVWFYVHGPIARLALEPLKVSQTGVELGWADLITPLEMILRHAGYSATLSFRIPAIVGLLAACVCALLLSRARTLSHAAIFALVLLCTLLCLKHLIYDYVALIPALALVLRAPRSITRSAALLGIAFFWYGSSVIYRLQPHPHLATVLLNVAVLLATTVAVAQLARAEVATRPSTALPDPLEEFVTAERVA